MKLQGAPEEWIVSQSQLGRIIGVSHQRVNQLIDEHVVLRDESSKSGAVLLIDSLKNYWLSKNVAIDGGKGVDFWKEKGAHERAKRMLTELKLREREGELYEAETVEAVMSEHLTNFRTKLLGISSKLSPQLEGKTRAEIYDILTLEIENALDELSQNYKSADFKVDADDDIDGEEFYS